VKNLTLAGIAAAILIAGLLYRQNRLKQKSNKIITHKNEELQQVYDRANRVVKQVAEAEKYDAILQEAIYINPKHDITDKVIKALNASVSTPSSASSPTGGK